MALLTISENTSRQHATAVLCSFLLVASTFLVFVTYPKIIYNLKVHAWPGITQRQAVDHETDTTSFIFRVKSLKENKQSI